MYANLHKKLMLISEEGQIEVEYRVLGSKVLGIDCEMFRDFLIAMWKTAGNNQNKIVVVWLSVGKRLKVKILIAEFVGISHETNHFSVFCEFPAYFS